MKKRALQHFVGALALLCSSVGLAATVTVTGPTDVNVGDTFTLTVSGDFTGFNVGAATLGLTFNSAVVSVTSPTSANLTIVPGSPWDGGGITGPDPFLSGDRIDLTAPTSGALPTGVFDAFQINFTAVGAGSAAITLVDNGCNPGILCWADGDTFDPIPATYTQADVTVHCAGPCITVADSVAPTTDHLVPFGSVTVGQTPTRTVTITSTGSATLNVATLTAPGAPFSLVNDMCSGQALAQNVSCTVDVQFSPIATGDFSSSFDIPSNDPANLTVTVTLSGTGTPVPAPNIVVTDSVVPANDQDVPFGTINVGAMSTQTVTITNNGTADLNIFDIAMADPLAVPFSVANDGCSNHTLTPAANCTFDVQFQPGTADPFNDTLDIPSDDPDTPTVTVTVSGTGVIPLVPDIAVADSVAPADDNTIPFGSITVGAMDVQTVTVTNNGNGNLDIGTIATVSGAPPFSIANDNCSNLSITPTNSCTFDVQFQPVAAGAFNDTVHIPSNDPDTPTASVAVSGAGLVASVPNILVTDSVEPVDDLNLPFGSLAENTTGAQTVTVINAGTEDLVIGAVATADPLAAPFSITADNCSGQTLASTESCTIDLEFAAGPIETFNDSFDIPSNDPDLNQQDVTVQVHGSAQPGVRHTSPGGSALDPATLLGLGLLGLAVKRRRRPRV